MTLIPMLRFTTLLLFLFFSLYATAQSSNDYLKQADVAYKTGEKERAKQLYTKAAGMGNADAHFKLAEMSPVANKTERIHHYSEAAKKGHTQALENVLQLLVFNANSLTLGNPVLAYDIYQQAKRTKPDLTFEDEQSMIETVKKCVKAEPFDALQFIEANKITLNDTYDLFPMWKLAEEASRNGRFGPPNMKLTLQLLCRAESEDCLGCETERLGNAIDDVYNRWVNNIIDSFESCKYLGSSWLGANFCSAVYSDKVKDTCRKRLDSISKEYAIDKKLLIRAFDTAVWFIDIKAIGEEAHDGSSHNISMNESIDSQRIGFINTIENVCKGFEPKLVNSKSYDADLNNGYKALLSYAKINPTKGIWYTLDENEIRYVQQSWVKYRNETASLLNTVNKSLTLQQWKNYLTQIRTEQLNEVLAFMKDANE